MHLIRKATVEDAEALGRIHSHTWQAAYAGIIPDEFLIQLAPESRAAFFKQKLLEPAVPGKLSENFIALDQDTPVGLLALHTAPDIDVAPGTGSIAALYVLPQHQGRGFGRSLMDYGVKRLKETGHTGVILWVLEQNTRAIRFYERYGYVYDGTSKEIVLGKPLVEIRYFLPGD
jgi:ribosomal protein S18 acetylase RimI-like enzyme